MTKDEYIFLECGKSVFVNVWRETYLYTTVTKIDRESEMVTVLSMSEPCPYEHVYLKLPAGGTCNQMCYMGPKAVYNK